MPITHSTAADVTFTAAGSTAWGADHSITDGTVVWTALGAGSGSATTANGDSAIVYQVAQTTASRISWRFTESVAGVSTGTPVLVQIDTLAASTALPLVVSARGTEVFRVPAAGGQILLADASVAAPILGFANDTDTGIFRQTTNFLGIAAGGIEVAGANTAGFVLISGSSLRWSSTASLSDAGDLFLVRDAANVLAQRNGTNAQEFRVENTFTGATDREFGKLEWASNVFNVGTEKGSAGGTARAMAFLTDDVERLRILATSPHLIQAEATTDPGTGDLTADAAVAIYNKNDKLVFAYNNAGTVTYVSIPLDGTTTTWTHSTTAP